MWRWFVSGLAALWWVPAALADDAAVLAVADRALEMISEENFEGFTDLWIDEAIAVAAGQRDGEDFVSVRNREQERALSYDVDIVERGWDPKIMVSGPVAMVWYPYDLYVDGEWLHCGVDIFNLVRSGGEWKIAAVTFSVEQPPDCAKHPDGPPSEQN